jgi:hypothetical protein
MKTDLELNVVDVDRLNGGLIIYFNDGEQAFYEASLLRSMFARATEIDQRAGLDEDLLPNVLVSPKSHRYNPPR